MEHKECIRRAGRDARKLRIKGEKALVAAQMATAPTRIHTQLKYIGSDETGSWLTVLHERRTDTLLSKEEMRNDLCLRYGMRPIYLPDRCNGCGQGFSVDHALKYNQGGLVCVRHNNVCNEAGQCDVLTCIKVHVSYEPHIFYGANVTATGSNHIKLGLKAELLATRRGEA